MKNKIKKTLLKLKRKKYASKIKNNISIISNDCCAGCIYSDVGMKFLSPTINLYIKGEDFVRFIDNLNIYINLDLKEQKDIEKEYPIGILDDEKHGIVKIEFVHYKSFEDAKIKWDERKKRIDFNRILVLFHVNDENIKFVGDILKSKYNKRIIAYRNQKIDKNDNVIFIKRLKKFVPAKILKTRKITGKRFLEEINYVSLFNDIYM